GTNDQLRSRFARVQMRTAPSRRASERAEETLLIEWPEDETEPTKYWLSTLDKNISFRRLVDIAKMRWRVERDYQELKQEVGLGHYEGRSWPGFHHHGTLCIVIYGFLISERETIPPLRTWFLPEAQKTCPSQWLPTPRRPRSGRNGTSQIRSPPFIADWASRSPEPSRAARAARAASQGAHGVHCDAVILGAFAHADPPCTRFCTPYETMLMTLASRAIAAGL